jgi:hypothetical protein
VRRDGLLSDFAGANLPQTLAQHRVASCGPWALRAHSTEKSLERIPHQDSAGFGAIAGPVVGAILPAHKTICRAA